MMNKNLVKGAPLDLTFSPNPGEPPSGWGMFTVDLVVKKPNTKFEYRRRLTARSKEGLQRTIIKFMRDEKLLRHQLCDSLSVKYESSECEKWNVDELWKLKIETEIETAAPLSRLELIARAAAKKKAVAV